MANRAFLKDFPLETRIGVIGGGQLGKMMCLAAKRLGFYITVLDPSRDCPASTVCDRLITAGFDGGAAFMELARLSDVVTYEFEHINAETLMDLELNGATVYPTASSLTLIQDKLTQKEALKSAGVPTPDFMPVRNVIGAAKAFGYPFVLKTRKGGYDGKGNFLVKDEGDLPRAIEWGADKPLVAERFVPFRFETSVLACRGADGAVVTYPVGLNTHKDGVLDKTVVPAPLTAAEKEAAEDTARRVMSVFDGVGMFCVELFVTDSGGVLVNEVAPRPHNSGHYTIEGCVCSQFENHIRAITGLPLGSPRLTAQAVVMRNILAAEGSNGAARVYGAAEALRHGGVGLHIYGKSKAVSGRKMGHLTAVGGNVEETERLADLAFSSIKIAE